MNATPKRPYKMIGKDGDAYVVCQPDKHGKNRTIAHVYDADPAYQIVRAVNAHDAMKKALEQAIARIEVANQEGNPIMSAWLPDAKAALALAKGDQ